MSESEAIRELALWFTLAARGWRLDDDELERLAGVLREIQAARLAERRAQRERESGRPDARSL